MVLAVINSGNGARVAAAGILAELIGIPWIQLGMDPPPDKLRDIPYLLCCDKDIPGDNWLDRARIIIHIPPRIRQTKYLFYADPPAFLPNGVMVINIANDPIGEFLACYRTSISHGPPQQFYLEEVAAKIRQILQEQIKLSELMVYPVLKLPWANGVTSIACITGDVDALHGRSFFANLRRFLRALLKKDEYRKRQSWRALKLRRFPSPFELIQRFVEPVENLGGHCTLFWAVNGKHRLDPQYSLEETSNAELVKKCATGNEVGLHGSYHSASHPEKLLTEYQLLKDLAGTVTGTRQHYLRLDGINTWLSQRSLGIEYDSTLCARKGLGFNCGIATPFPLFDPNNGVSLDIWELPVMFMDGGLFQYEHPDMLKAFPMIKQLIERTSSVHGCITLLYHPQVLIEEIHPTVYQSYQKILELLDESSIPMLSAKEAISWRNQLWSLYPTDCRKDNEKYRITLTAKQNINGLVVVDHMTQELFKGNLLKDQDITLFV